MRAAHAVLAILLATALAACSQSDSSKAPTEDTQAETAAAPPKPASAESIPRDQAPAKESAASESAELGAIESAGGGGSGGGGSYPDILPGAGPPDMSTGQGAPPPEPTPAPPPAVMPPAAAADPPATSPTPKNGHSGSKVLSYFQQGRTKIDTSRAFGFVLMPKLAVSDAEKRAQKDFCVTVLASMDFMTPGAVSSSTPAEVLATFWPVVGSRESFEVKDAFQTRDCDALIAWYDHKLARTLAAKAGVGDLSGPLLITWPATGEAGAAARDPLIVDFSRANQTLAKKALQYWFRQVKSRPELWTNRIREGTIRAELADAVNDTAGVMLSVLAGKWDSLTVVASAP